MSLDRLRFLCGFRIVFRETNFDLQLAPFVLAGTTGPNFFRLVGPSRTLRERLFRLSEQTKQPGSAEQLARAPPEWGRRAGFLRYF
jgi:hypothetical protein